MSADVLQRDVHPWFALDKLAPHLFTPGRLRHLLRQRERNGLASHLVWLGRTPFIREAELASWLDEQRDARRREVASPASRYHKQYRGCGQ